MSESITSIEQNLMDAGCDTKFIVKFMNLIETQCTAEMLNMLDIHRKHCSTESTQTSEKYIVSIIL